MQCGMKWRYEGLERQQYGSRQESQRKSLNQVAYQEEPELPPTFAVRAIVHTAAVSAADTVMERSFVTQKMVPESPRGF